MSTTDLTINQDHAQADYNAAGFTPIKAEEFRAACNRFLRSRGLQAGDYYRETKDQINQRKLQQTKAPINHRKQPSL